MGRTRGILVGNGVDENGEELAKNFSVDHAKHIDTAQRSCQEPVLTMGRVREMLNGTLDIVKIPSLGHFELRRKSNHIEYSYFPLRGKERRSSFSLYTAERLGVRIPADEDTEKYLESLARGYVE